MIKPLMTVARSARIAALLIGAAFAYSCATTPYDAVTDQSVTDLQKKVDAYVSRAATQPAADMAFYDSIAVDVHSLEIRENARLTGGVGDSVAPTTQQVSALQKALDDLKTVDQGTTGQPARSRSLKAVGENLDRIFESLLHLELFRKS